MKRKDKKKVKKKEEMRKEEKRREEKEEKKIAWKNTLNFKINFIVKLYDNFKENYSRLYIFWSFKDFWSFGLWYSDIFSKSFIHNSKG